MKILVIVARGLQASLIGAYGNHWISTPTLDGLTARGILFDRHYADVASAEGTRHAWLTGRMALPLSAATTPAASLLRVLREADIPTLLVHDVSRPLPESFLQGWSATVEVEAEGDENPLELALQGTSDLLEALREESNGLIWLDLPTLLPPWSVPDEIVAPLFDYELIEESAAEESEAEESEAEESAAEESEAEESEADLGEEVADEEEEEVEDEVLADEEEEELPPLEEDEIPPEYLAGPELGAVDPLDQQRILSLRMSQGAAVNYLDLALAALVQTLDDLDPKREIAVVVTSDHGFPLGEHGVVGPAGAGPHEELLHLPLIVRLPGEEQAGRRVESLCQPMDLAVTLAELLGVSLSEPQGRSLLPAMRGEAGPLRPYLVAFSADGRGSLRTPDWSFVAPQHLFLQPEDAWEVNDVRQHHLELTEHAENVLRAARTACEQPGQLLLPELRDEAELQAEATEDR